MERPRDHCGLYTLRHTGPNRDSEVFAIRNTALHTKTKYESRYQASLRQYKMSFGPYPPWFAPPWYWSMYGPVAFYPGPLPAMPPPPPYMPPPIRSPPAATAAKKRPLYDTPDVSRVKVHVILVPPGANADALYRSGGGPQFKFKVYNLPLSMTMPDFFRKIGAFKDKKVVHEAVEEGNGAWSAGTKLMWGKGPATLGDVEWERVGKNDPVWVVIRAKKRSE